MITPELKDKIEHIVNVFETGSIAGGYAAVSIYKDGKNNSRQITYGRSQTTEQGNLRTLLEMYGESNGEYARDFRSYVKKVGKTPLTDDKDFIQLLKKAGKDPVMQQVQDHFFDIVYYFPALQFFDGYKFILPLSMLVIYDSYIHSGSVPGFLRQRFTEVPPSMGGDEKKWIVAYTNVRHEWLLHHSRAILRKTAYRTACFLAQIKAGNWQLTEPVDANNVIVP